MCVCMSSQAHVGASNDLPLDTWAAPHVTLSIPSSTACGELAVIKVTWAAPCVASPPTFWEMLFVARSRLAGVMLWQLFGGHRMISGFSHLHHSLRHHRFTLE